MRTIPDPEQPEYFLESFPRDAFPAYVWTERPATLPADVWMTETTHRDGQQGGLPLTTEQSLRIYDIMCRFSGASKAIRQAEFFVYRPSDRKALEGALERYRAGAPIEPTTWIRATARDVALIQSLGIRETGMLASSSDYHTFHKFKPGGRNQAAQTYLEAVRLTLEAGIRPRLHLEDATRAPMDFIKPFIEAVQELAAPYGNELRPKIRVCDTMGLGLPYEDVALPRSVPRLIKEICTLGIQSEDLEFHPHNDTWLIVANCLAAIRAGCSVINGTLLGKGERTGNAPLEGVLLHVLGMGYFQEQRPDFTVLNELTELYAEMGEPIPPKYPLYGKDAHRTRAGVHADGLNKFWWMYAPFNVPQLLGRPLEVSLTKESGLAGLIFVIRQHMGLELAKDDPRLLAIHNWLIGEFDNGRQTSVEWEELHPIVEQHLGNVPA
ncbi:2-phosphinomethylmalic acid synthase [Thermosporothrix hazakensis]|jgi:2-phosphinomethylmalic acid synthase|uniref:2-phosphinomethylmalic acid synthase n=1 Tax=Thermosporothrix hazakensis TaxID=644383 RepID=A0A326U0J1_THEHA|nr:pyruvate carboxyltransferase [Thermosporothrix hazakensis]PZW22926.1 2-phosphinomethylmalic acid synthase [Thermosporothrix hazakensis]GCE47985.1 HMGL-related enzyme [Thermosporothrix hazakensis]